MSKITRFREFDQSFLSFELARQMEQVQEIDLEFERERKTLIAIAIAVVAWVPISLIWIALISVLGLWLGFLNVAVGSSAVGVAGLIFAWLLTDPSKKDAWLIWLRRCIAGLSLPILCFNVLPLVLLVAIVAAGFKYGRLNPEVKRLIADDRVGEYRSLMSHLAIWNEWAKFLNRLVMKLECGVIPEGLVTQAVEGLEAMRRDQDFLMSRIRYAEELAREGRLGASTSRQELLGEDFVLDQSTRLRQARDRVRQLQEIDARTIAALEIAAAGR